MEPSTSVSSQQLWIKAWVLGYRNSKHSKGNKGEGRPEAISCELRAVMEDCLEKVALSQPCKGNSRGSQEVSGGHLLFH